MLNLRTQQYTLRLRGAIMSYVLWIQLGMRIDEKCPAFAYSSLTESHRLYKCNKTLIKFRRAKSFIEELQIHYCQIKQRIAPRRYRMLNNTNSTVSDIVLDVRKIQHVFITLLL